VDYHQRADDGAVLHRRVGEYVQLRRRNMALITGKYLEDPQNPDLTILEPENSPLIVEWPEDLSETGTLEEMEELFLTILRVMDHDAVPFAVPTFEVEGRHYPLTHEAFSDLSDDAQEKVHWFPTMLVVIRLARDEDVEVLPESLARELLTIVGIEVPDASPFTISFGSAASIVLESLPRKGPRDSRRRGKR
jgi:hypothetical protein